MSSLYGPTSDRAPRRRAPRSSVRYYTMFLISGPAPAEWNEIQFRVVGQIEKRLAYASGWCGHTNPMRERGLPTDPLPQFAPNVISAPVPAAPSSERSPPAAPLA